MSIEQRRLDAEAAMAALDRIGKGGRGRRAAAFHAANPHHHALQGRQFQQLPMFMSANEIKRDYTVLEGDRHATYDEDGDENGYETDDEVFERKRDEAWDMDDRSSDRGLTLYQSIEEQGVKHPIHLGTGEPRGYRETDKPQIFGGHHRVAVMEEIGADELMPVLHHEDWYKTSANQEGFRYR